jgi:hypothetical protein
LRDKERRRIGGEEQTEIAGSKKKQEVSLNGKKTY